MSLSCSPNEKPYEWRLELTDSIPTAPEIVRYAIEQGIQFWVDDFSAQARQRDTTDASNVAIGLIICNQENVLRLITGLYYHGDFRCTH